MISIALSLATLAMAPLTNHADYLGMETPPTVTVVYRDLDLSHPEGVAKLDARIRAAARELCVGSEADLAFLAEVANCRAKAIASAHSQRLAAVEQATQFASRGGDGGEVARIETRTGR